MSNFKKFYYQLIFTELLVTNCKKFYYRLIPVLFSLRVLALYLPSGVAILGIQAVSPVPKIATFSVYLLNKNLLHGNWGGRQMARNAPTLLS